MTAPATTSPSRISIDYYNATVHAVGEQDGISDAQIDGLSGRVATEHARIHAEHDAGEQRWMNLPDDLALVEEIEAFAAEARERYTDFILVGIGGSSLGALATIQALAHPFRNLQPDGVRVGPRLFLLDNPDPEKVQATLDTVDLPNTLISVVSKSGQTAETMANFLVARQALVDAVGEEQAVRQIVATTDNHSGLLRVLSDAAGYRTFPVPDGVDGRQTVLSAVGLLPAALAGIDIRQLLAGAAAMRAATQGDDIRSNPAYLLAALTYLADTERGKSMLVTMPYNDSLYGLADWFRQLWAESLGKRLSTDGREVFAGQTPINSLGAIDQHSQIQLYTEGPNDKLIALVSVGEFRSTVNIPNPPAETPELSYLANGELGQLLDRELLATAWALREAKRPNLTISTPIVDAFALGEFFYLHQLQTVMAGALYGVNPFGQPGVEAGKNATYALMGRAGYEQLRADLTGTVEGADKYRLQASTQR